jgi:hypothetical protein
LDAITSAGALYSMVSVMVFVGLLLRGKFRSNGAACQWVFFHFEKLFFEGQNGFFSENLRPAFERDVGAFFAVELIACEKQVVDCVFGSFDDFFVAEHEKRLPHGRENARVFFFFFDYFFLDKS